MSHIQDARFSENFTYDTVGFEIECDGSITSDTAGVGWVIIDTKTQEVIAEGRKRIKGITTTEEAEIKAVEIALKDFIGMIGENSKTGVIIRTDYNGLLNEIDNGVLVDNLNNWSVECVPRDGIKRAHKLANSVF